MTDIDTIKTWLEEQYNSAISVYPLEHCARITNGSAGYYIDIYPHGNTFVLEGELYGETVNDSCDATRDALLDRLSTHI